MEEEIKKQNWFRKHWIFTIFLCFILLGLFNSILFGSLNGNSNTDLTGNVINENSNNNAQKAQDTVYNIGDSIQAGDFKWKITMVSTSDEVGSDYVGQKADGIFVILDVEVENTADSAQYFMDSNLKLIDNQGREFSPSTASIYLGDSALIFQQINPGIIKKGKIVYDVPTSDNDFTLKIISNLFESDTYNLKVSV